MSILKKTKVRSIKYYGIDNWSTGMLILEFLENKNFIINSISAFQNYNNLLDKDFILGFYTLNLLFFNEDIKNKKFTSLIQKNPNIPADILQIMNTLKLKNIEHAINIFKNWILENLNFIFKEIFIKELECFYILYNDILLIFIENLNFKSAEQTKKFILLVNKNPNIYPDILNRNSKYKSLIIEEFKIFIEELIKNKKDLIQYQELIDCYLNFVREDISKKEIITCYYKNQINQIKTINKISIAEAFMNLVKKHGLKFQCTKKIILWYENLKKEIFNSNQISLFKLSFNVFENKEEHNSKINQFKENIKNGSCKYLFYLSELKTSFNYSTKSSPIIKKFILHDSIGTYNKLFTQNIDISQSIKFLFFSQIFHDKEIFKIYTDNFADILECVLYDLEAPKEERNFFMERYYEIIEQINDERENKNNLNQFAYMKKIALLLTAIEDFIKIFIEKNEKNNIVNNLDQPFSRYLIQSITNDIKKGAVFIPSDYIKAFLSDKAKLVLNYYLYAKAPDGLEIRNLVMHGSHLSHKFHSQVWFFQINLLFFQLVEEVVMNYIFFKYEKINFDNFFNLIEISSANFFKEFKLSKIGEKILTSNLSLSYEKFLIKEFQNYSIKNKLNISDYAVNFKLSYDSDKRKFGVELELYKTFVFKNYCSIYVNFSQ